MPNLSEDSLKKRFTCQYCGKSIRTRQGLSGHIQFKHGQGNWVKKIDSEYILDKVKYYGLAAEKAGLPASEIAAKKHILLKWLEVQAFCEIMQIQLHSNDFKNYITTRLALIHDREM